MEICFSSYISISPTNLLKFKVLLWQHGIRAMICLPGTGTSWCPYLAYDQGAGRRGGGGFFSLYGPWLPLCNPVLKLHLNNESCQGTGEKVVLMSQAVGIGGGAGLKLQWSQFGFQFATLCSGCV